MTRSVAPVLSSTFSTCFQVVPPSVVLYTPRSPPGPQSDPVAATRTVLLSSGSITMRAIARELGRPMFFHDVPPSVDFHTPPPQEELWRLFDSPEPTHTRSGLRCDMVTSPIEI